MSKYLTKARIEAIQPGPKIQSFVDGEVPGLSLIVLPSGRKTFSLFYRHHRQPRRIKIGVYGVLTLQQARDRARKMLYAVSCGNDPAAEKAEAKAAPTVGELCDEFDKMHIAKLRPNSQDDYRSMLRKWVRPEWSSRLARDLTKADVTKLHSRMSIKTVRAPGDATSRDMGGCRRANFMLQIVSRMFTYAIEAGYRADNPCKGIKHNPEHARSRYLTETEIARLMAALDAYPLPSGNAIRLLLLTGSRRAKILGARWSQFDLDAATPTWTKPHTLTKQAREHRIPLSAPAVAVLRAMWEKSDGNGFLFPSKNGCPQQGLKRAWGTICEMAQISDCRVHDLRHSYASILVNAGCSLPMIGALLGHRGSETTLRYAHLMDATLKAATEAAGRTITAVQSSGLTLNSRRAA